MSGHDWVSIIGAVTAAVGSISAAVVSLINAVRGARVEKKVDQHEVASQRRSALLAGAIASGAGQGAGLAEAASVLEVASPLPAAVPPKQPDPGQDWPGLDAPRASVGAKGPDGVEIQPVAPRRE